jgi:hypothetical protein
LSCFDVQSTLNFGSIEDEYHHNAEKIHEEDYIGRDMPCSVDNHDGTIP